MIHPPRFLMALGLLMTTAACSSPVGGPEGEGVVPRQNAPTGAASLSLPKQAGVWVRPDAPRRVTAETIFDYMDGGGELYVAYRFDHLDVFEYTAADRSVGTVLLEIYWMRSPDDAFGLLSTDWSGEPVELPGGRPGLRGAASSGRSGGGASRVPPHRALYGAGLLRLWTGDLYARVLASRETPASREQVIAIGRAVAALRPAADPPAALAALPPPEVAGYRARDDRTCFFRSHLVLNQAFFLASRDILGLGPEVEGVTTEYASGTPDERPARVVVVDYPSETSATAALASFRTAYLPEHGAGDATSAAPTAKTEQGWVGVWRERQRVRIVFDARSQEAARQFGAAGSRR